MHDKALSIQISLFQYIYWLVLMITIQSYSNIRKYKEIYKSAHHSRDHILRQWSIMLYA